MHFLLNMHIPETLAGYRLVVPGTTVSIQEYSWNQRWIFPFSRNISLQEYSGDLGADVPVATDILDAPKTLRVMAWSQYVRTFRSAYCILL
jgi:hypothetical protein